MSSCVYGPVLHHTKLILRILRGFVCFISHFFEFSSSKSPALKIQSRAIMIRCGTTVRKLSTSTIRNVVLVDGCRIPFTLAGTNYKDYLAVNLARMALKGLLCKTALDAEKVGL